jgi:tetratricopeptide (TPR) repeat protein
MLIEMGFFKRTIVKGNKALRWILLMFAFFGATEFSCAQDARVVDSLTSLIRNDHSRSDLEIFHELAFQFVNHDNERSLQYLDKGILIAEKIRDSVKFVTLNRLKGQVLRRLGERTLSVELLQKILPIAQRHALTSETTYILSAIALTYTQMGRFDKALQWDFRALDFSEKNNDSSTVARAFLNIGFLHLMIDNNDKAIEYFERSLNIAEAMSEKDLALMNQVNIATVLISKKQFKEGKERIEQALRQCNADCMAWIIIPGWYGLAESQLNLGLLDSAEVRFRDTYHASIQTNDHRFMAESLIMLSKIEIQKHRFDSAKLHLDKAYEIAESAELLVTLSRAQYFYSELYKAKNDSDKAVFFLSRYVKLRDSILSEEVRNRMLVTEIEYNQKTDRLKLAHREELLVEQRMQTQLITIICVLISMLAVALFLILRQKQNANLKLDSRVRERTRELEENKAALERANQEQTALIGRTTQSVKSVLATHKGIRESIVKHGSNISGIALNAIEEELNDSLRNLSVDKKNGVS